MRTTKFLSALLLTASAELLSNCAEPCTGHIEGTVLYFTEGSNHQDQLVYANVLNKPGLGVQHKLMRADKEFGTFPNVVIIADPQSKYKGRRNICFDTFTRQPKPADAPLDEADIPQIALP